MCANVMHKLADGILSMVGKPLLHIVDFTASTLKAAGVRKRLLPATRYTMEQDFYLSRLRDLNGIEAMVPELEDRLAVHDIIFDELCQGIVSHASQRRYLEILIGPQHLDPSDLRLHAVACRRRGGIRPRSRFSQVGSGSLRPSKPTQ